MVKVKLLRLPESDGYEFTKEEEDRVGKIFEAFELKFSNETRFGLYIEEHKCLWYVPLEYCEIVEAEKASAIQIDDDRRIVSQHKNKPRKVLIVEDGSVDVDHIENDLGIDCIIYRCGASKPEFLEY